jgi:poly(A) polymerase
MKITGDWLSAKGTQDLCRMLTQAGYQALFVGGCVRNSLLGVPISDIDIATDSLPEIVSELAENASFHVIPTGIDHGTVTIIADHIVHEVTTFRRDVSTDGRRATVAFASDIVADASRRDFTMNALYATSDGTVIDPLGGLPDLQARRLRFVGDASQRIAEDYLRILRFFRFHAHYADPDGGFDAEALAACAAGADGLDALSRERVGSEMRKLLAAPDPAPAVAAMAQAGILGRVLPGADARLLPVLVHLEDHAPPRWQRRLAILGGTSATDQLRLARVEATEIGHIRAALDGSATIAALGWLYGADVAGDVALLRSAIFETPPAPDWQAEAVRGAGATFPVAAADLMPDLEGVALGAKLKELQTRWLASDLHLGKAQLLA